MPFKSKAQRAWMHSQKPELAKRWEKETPSEAALPEHAPKKGKTKGAAFPNSAGPEDWDVLGDSPWKKGEPKDSKDKVTETLPGRLKRAEVLQPPYLQYLYRMGKFDVWAVDGPWIRKHLDEDFTNFGQHFRFPFIPRDQFWIDREMAPGEDSFFVTHMVLENQLMELGVPYVEAVTRAAELEQQERQKSERYHEAATDPEKVEHVHIKLLGNVGDLQVWLVDGELVRNWFYTDFTEGGHDLVYNWVPPNEVWMDNDLGAEDFPYVLLHEVFERERMAEGLTYPEAHKASLKVELEAREKGEVPERYRMLPQGNLIENQAKVSSMDDIEGGDPTKLMPQLRAIHKMGHRISKTAAGVFPGMLPGMAGQDPELDALMQRQMEMTQYPELEYSGADDSIDLGGLGAMSTPTQGLISPAMAREMFVRPTQRAVAEINVRLMREELMRQALGKYGHIISREKVAQEEYAETGPNAGQGAPHVSWQMPGKLKRSAGLDQEHMNLDDQEKGTDPPASFSQPTEDRLTVMARERGPIKKISQVSYRALLDEFQKLGEESAKVQPPPDKKHELLTLIRKAGPGIGAVGGTAYGLASGLKGGKLIEKTLTGLGTGALLGAVPDYLGSAHDAWKAYRK